MAVLTVGYRANCQRGFALARMSDVGQYWMVAVVFTPAHGGDCFNDAGQRERCYYDLFFGSPLVAANLVPTNLVIFSSLIG